MGILGNLALILQVIRALPEAIRLIKELIDLFRGLKNDPQAKIDVKSATRKFREALIEAREKRDAKPLEEFHKALTTACVGDACGMPEPK